ncbi:hypothetical protein PACID_33930 [Acidipropionibacterium acidipropionici ATCC 4875]|uniref:Uncharacterized protein n=1 Tax=Acidipropionibacterium acidipropionici (strain ATCC 4875 / DSM 20272 / JCM 6432 / NBRC 12425 / NCIMB 8070 / 4) TaxID=1171373 RepID=K7RST5_ACIA4|nr:hypothetical protein PACID_33930 [Acidipropionibacterium acidipropionici ATCC 4875]
MPGQCLEQSPTQVVATADLHDDTFPARPGPSGQPGPDQAQPTGRC